MRVFYTIGHSTPTAAEFLSLLTAHHVTGLADGRSVPHSSRFPHFSRSPLEAFLHAAGIAYRHFPALGGMRTPRSDSINTAWREPGFRGYADHMQSHTFQLGLAALDEFAAGGVTVLMCAGALWWQCHRQLLADLLSVRGVPVRHIMSAAEPNLHVLSEFAREHEGRVIYPGLL